MRAGIPELLSPFATSFPLLSLSAASLSSLLIVISRDFPHTAFPRRLSHANDIKSEKCHSYLPCQLCHFVVLLMAIPSHMVSLVLCRCRKSIIARAINDGPPTGKVPSVWPYCTSRSISFIHFKTHIFRPASTSLASPTSRGTSPVPETTGKSARVNFAIARNSREESATTRETIRFVGDLSNKFDD